MNLALLLTRIAFASIATALILFSALLQTHPSVEAQTGNRDLIVKSAVKELPAKSKRWALIIGVDRYEDTQITPLEGAVNDAKLLADALVQYAGFPKEQVILLASDQPMERRPTRGTILRWLSNLRGVVPEDGLLLVSFAGHGIERNGRGFLCSSDAQSSGSIDLLEDTAIDVDILRQRIHQTRVKQVLVILDACRNDPSGRGITANRLTNSYAERFNFDVANQGVIAFATLYATDVGNVAFEYKEKKHGYFTWTLVEGLRGAAANDRGEVTLAGLVKYIQEQVPRRVRLELGQDKAQKPYARTEGYKADELVISIAERVSSATNLPSIGLAAMELEFWNSMKNSADVEDFREYLKQYPNGRFAGLALNRIRQLEAAKSSLPVTNLPPTNTATNLNGTQPISPAAKKQENVEVQTYTENVKGVGIEMVLVPAGKFLMGSPVESDGEPQHEVTISRSFYMGKHEVTQAQWRTVAKLPKVKVYLDENPSYFKGDTLPVEQVSWDEAVEFCDRLSKATGKTYRLPTEAEWEYACRAGTTGMYAGSLDLMAWYGNNSGETTHPVGQKQANQLGLYDMYGNVCEWCLDWHGSYLRVPQTDPTGPASGSIRVFRGGSFIRYAQVLGSSSRYMLTDTGYDYFGFRLVRTYN